MTTTLVHDLMVGGVVSLEIAWGTQRRLRCPSCQHFTSGFSVVFCRCGAVYNKIDDSPQYRVELLP
jgi:hypothetical protein